MDAGYVSAERILQSRDAHAIDLMGPVQVDPSWQAQTPGAVEVSQFAVDWRATCPQGRHSRWWYRGKDVQGESVVQVVFAQQTCQDCALRSQCTDARHTGRSLTLRFPQERHEALHAARARQHTDAFKTL